MKEVDNLTIRKEMAIEKSHSIIAFNLQTIEDVEQVIRQCEALRQQMTGGLERKFTILEKKINLSQS